MSAADQLETAPPPAHRVARNTALRAAAEILGKFATLALTSVMFIKLGTDAAGQFGFALAVSQLYWPIAGFGLDRLMLREIAIDNDQTANLVPKLNSFKLVVGLLCAVVGTLFVSIDQGWGTVSSLTLILGLSLVATLIGATAQNVFMARERMEDFFLAALPVKVFSAIVGIVILLLGGGILAVGAASLFAAIVGVGIGWWILSSRYGQPPAALDRHPRTWLPLLRRSGPWGLQEVFGQITFRFGFILLFLTAGDAIAGEYRAGYQLLEATLFLPWSIAASVLPLVARSRRGEVSAEGEPSLEVITRSGIELVLALLLPIAVLLGLCAAPILKTIYTSAALPAASYLPYLAAASVIYGVGHIAGLVALSHLPGRRTVEVMAISAIFSVAIVVALVPTHGAPGAAWAALATESVLSLLSLRLAVKAAGPTILLGFISTSTVAAAVMAAAVLPFRDDLIPSVLVGGCVYAVVLLALEYRRQGATWALMRRMVPGQR
ncbi:MAG: oligosaccharide flippase family protein [Solirubrobacteraceae bacterium]|nr:oligosaccharide flippase family protein [Solirubrobacteraceae bacterium]